MFIVLQFLRNVGGYSVDSFLNTAPLEEQIDGIPVRKADSYIKDYKPDAYMIAAGHQRSIFDMTRALASSGAKEIYLLQDIAGKNRLKLFDEKGERDDRRLKKYRLSDNKPVLPYFEVPVVDDCNLNCKGCVFGCNANVDGRYMPVEQLKKDLLRIRDLFSDVLWIRILGGEPLLHPEIVRIVELFRSIFPHTEVDLCTNGLLLHSMSNVLFETLRSLHITVHVSGYPPIMRMKDKSVDMLDIYGIEHTFIKRDKFFKFYREAESSDIDENHETCPTRGCPELYYGKILKCSALFAFERFNGQFGTHYVIGDKDSVSIHDEGMTGEKIIRFLSGSAPLCRYCDTKNIKYFEWESGGEKPELRDYVIS